MESVSSQRETAGPPRCSQAKRHRRAALSEQDDIPQPKRYVGESTPQAAMWPVPQAMLSTSSTRFASLIELAGAATVISMFSAQQHHDILKYGYNPNIVLLVEKAMSCVQQCECRGIILSQTRSRPKKPILFAMLVNYSFAHPGDKGPASNRANDIGTVITFFEKATVFFASTSYRIKGTGSLTGMVHKNYSGTNRRLILSLTNQSDRWLRTLAASPWLPSLSTMCCGQGVPSEQAVNTFCRQPCLRCGWYPGKDDKVPSVTSLNHDLLASIAGMCAGKGLPTEESVKTFLSMPCLRVGWLPGADEKAVQTAPLDQSLVNSIASMYNAKYMPPEREVKAFLSMPCLRLGWHPGISDSAIAGKPPDKRLVSLICSNEYRHKAPEEHQIMALLSAPCLRKGWRPGLQDADLKGVPLDRERVVFLFRRRHKMGMPAPDCAEILISDYLEKR